MCERGEHRRDGADAGSRRRQRANDVSKGIATLAGAGVALYRTAILWGTGTTFVGAIASAAFAGRLSVLFSRGIVAAPPTAPFALAVLTGATTWVCFATATRLPVSTTHALVGVLLGAGVELSPRAVNWAVVLTSVAAPLLLSVGAAYVASAALSRLPFKSVECTWVDIGRPVSLVDRGGEAAAISHGLMLPMIALTAARIQRAACTPRAACD